MYKRDKKEEDAGTIIRKLDKTTLLQETRYFNSTHLDPRICVNILAKIIYLIHQGESLTTEEATNMFFATTKLFQSKDVRLRCLLYLCLKELSPMAQDVIIVTSSLTKDMTGSEDLYRAPAIRALCKIIDSSMLQGIERYMKQAIIDKSYSVSSAALVSTLHLTSSAPDHVRRWGYEEAQEAMMSDNVMVSYHALGVVANMRRNDRLSTMKLVTKLTRASLRSPYSLALVIRLAAKLADEDPSEASKHYIDFIESCLRQKTEIVVYEAAHALVNMKKRTKGLDQVVTALQIFCVSSKPAVRLAGIRTLATLTTTHPKIAINRAIELENLITDSNRDIATLAVTTLLATGTDASIDRLLHQIPSFMSEISDEYKIVIVNAVKKLCTKYPRKHQMLASFLASMLREEGGLQYKSVIGDALIALMDENRDSRETCLSYLCDFIEDCEHSSLAIRILRVLAREGPFSKNPSKHIRYIYNRVILESTPVRAAAVSALALFGATCHDLTDNVKVLLTRCHLDNDDEVRDRAVFYSTILESNDQSLINDYIINKRIPNPVLLKEALDKYILTANEDSEPFDIASVPTEENPQDKKKDTVDNASNVKTVSREEQYAEQLQIIPCIKKFGVIFKTCAAIDLTEPETEYRVRCIKHIFARHLVLQFECLNTLNYQLLEEVYIGLTSIPGYKILDDVHCERLPYNKQGSVFFMLQFPESPIESLGTFGAVLEFVVRECNPTTGIPDSDEPYADSYPLEDIEINCAEQFIISVAADDWEASWEKASAEEEATDTFGLAQTDVGQAALAVCKYLGLSNSAITGDAVKEIRGGGVWREGVPVLLKCRLVATQGTVTMQLVARSVREDIATLLLTAVG